MLLLLLCLLSPVDGSRSVTQDVTYEERHNHENVAVTTRPYIYYCRSPNMEDFSCWWHPLRNLTDGEATYLLTYSKDNGHTVRECPDYVTAGPNSCHFDSSHTAVWTMYCMNVTAVTAHRNYTSPEHCLDVADIVQTEAPVNLTYTLNDAGGDELGHNALLTWTYPVPSHLQYGWITLVYELQYRRVTEPNNWKVKRPLRDSFVELLGLPVGDYVVRVRCRSHNYGLWSKWSSTLLISFPTRPPAGRQLVLILVTCIGVLALLGFIFGIIPQSRRIKEYFLPPIPKPRIIGIDPLLLKKGNLDEINHHFSNFHNYRPPSYTEEIWDQVSSDDIYLTTAKCCSLPVNSTDRQKDTLMVPCDQRSVAAHHLLTAQNPGLYVQNFPQYCSAPPEAFELSPDVTSSWTRPEIVSLLGTDYSVMGHPNFPNSVPTPDDTSGHSPQDLYTCVQLMNESGEVHLVPCLPPTYCSEFPSFPRCSPDEKIKKLADYQTRKNLLNGSKDGGVAERGEAAVPLLPVAVESNG